MAMAGQCCVRCQDVASTLVASGARMIAVKETKNRSDEGRCHHRPVVTLTHSAWLVNLSLPVSTKTSRKKSSGSCWTMIHTG